MAALSFDDLDAPSDDLEQNYARNAPYMRSGASNFFTTLPPDQERLFRAWVGTNKVPFDPQAKVADYDMRGFWQALRGDDPRAKSAVDPNDKRLHYPDYWKTPYHQTFSNESQWASPDAPHWSDAGELIDKSGGVLFDDRAGSGIGYAGGGAVTFDDLDDQPQVDPADQFADRILQSEHSRNDQVSPKGAQAAMQVLPRTQADPGFGVTPAKNNSPDEINRVGRDYAKALLSHYDNEALAAAAYNAGPGNVDTWIKRYGDPRTGKISDSDFVSKIPSKEARDYSQPYVQQAAYHPGGGGAVSFEDLAPGSTKDAAGAISFDDVAPQKPKTLWEHIEDLMGGAQLPNPKAPQDTWLQEGKKFIQNVPAMLEKPIGGLIEGLGAPGNVPNEPGLTVTDYGALPPSETHVGGGAPVVEAAGKKIAQQAEQKLEANAPNVPGASFQGFANTVGQGAVEMAPALAAAAITKNPAIFSSGAATTAYGNSYADARQRGATPEQAQNEAAVSAAATSIGFKLFEYSPFRHFVGKVTNEQTGAIADAYKQTVGDTIKNLVTQGMAIQPAVNVVEHSTDNILNGKDVLDGLPGPILQSGLANTVTAGLGHIAARRSLTLGEWQVPQNEAYPYDPSAHFGSAPPIEPEGSQGPAGRGPSGAAGLLPNNAVPPPDSAIGIKFPDGSVQRATIEGYGANGSTVRLRFDDGSTVEHLTSEVMRDRAPPPPPRFETQPEPPKPYQRQLGPDEGAAPPFGEAPPAEPGKRAAAKISARQPQPVLDPQAIHALDLADRLEGAATDPGNPMSTNDRMAALMQVARIRQQFQSQGEESVPGAYKHPGASQERIGQLPVQPEPASYQHPGAAEPARDLGELGVARAINPAAYETIGESGSVSRNNTGEANGSQKMPDMLGTNQPNAPPAVRGVLQTVPPSDDQGANLEGQLQDRGNGAGSPADAHAAAQHDQQAAATDTNPTPAQATANNYKHGKLTVQGIPVSVETPKGALREGIGANGEPWQNRNEKAHYGYITAQGQVGTDGDHIDAYVGPHPNSPVAFVVDQVDPKTGAYDEHKAILGAHNESEARDIYNAGFSDGSGPSRIGAITKMPIFPFKEWLKDGDLQRPLNAMADPDYQSALWDVRDARSKAKTDKDILGTIVAMGGIKIDNARGQTTPEGQTIRQIVQDYRRPGLINNRSGMTPDYVREALTEQGWFGDRDAGQSDVRQLYDMLDTAVRGGKVFHPESDANSILERRALTDEEMGRAGVISTDSHADAAKKLLDFRRQGIEELAAHYEDAADEEVEKLSPGAIELLTQYGYEPGADHGAEHEVEPQPEEPQRAAETQREAEPSHEGQEHGGAGVVEPEGGGAAAPQEPAEGFRTTPGAIAAEHEAEVSHLEAAGTKAAGEKHARLPEESVDLGRGVEGKQAVIPGAEQSAKQLAQAREAAGHGRVKVGAEQKEPGGLFAEPSRQKTLFQVPKKSPNAADETNLRAEPIQPPGGVGKVPGEHALTPTGRGGEGRDNEGRGLPEAPEGHGNLPKGLKQPTKAQAAKPFFSALTRSVEAIKQEKAPAKQWEGIIDNLKTKGVKQDEIDWSGVKDWLAEQKGAVTKADLLNYLRDNEVQIKEVQLGQTRDDTSPDQVAQDEHGPEFERLNAEIRRTDADRTRYRRDPRYEKEYQKALDEDTKLREQREGLHERMVDETMARSGASGKPAKYGTYTLPGGELGSYRELLLTLPEREPELPRGYEVKPFQQGWGVFGPDGDEVAWGPTRGGALANAAPTISRKVGPANTFRSGHWDEPNVLAHIRMDDRAAPNGERVLHVAEIQSDWAQSGRRRGWRKENEQRLAALVKERDATPDGPERDHIQGEINTLGRRDVGVPDTPFKKTETWAAVAARRMLRYAAEHGYEKLTFDTGETQADRYDLSKQVDRVVVERDDKSEFTVRLFKDGKEIGNDSMPAEKLPDYVGKDLADKIVTDIPKPGGKTYSGLALKVGGEGQKGFYDKILPNLLNKYAKKWGAKVEPTTIQTSKSVETYKGPTPTKEQIQSVSDAIHARSTDQRFTSPITGERQESQINRVSNESSLRDVLKEMEQGKTFAEAMADHGSRDIAKIFGGEKVISKEGREAPAHAIAITPAMRDSVMAGQPLFQRSLPTIWSDIGGTKRLAPDFYARMPRIPSEGEAQLIEQINRIVKQIAPGALVIPAKDLTYRGKKIWGAMYVDGPRNVIAWAMEGPSPVNAVHHEAVHWLRNVGFFRPDEWETLSNAAINDNWLNKHDIHGRYAGEDFATQIEEAIAEEYASWAGRESTPPPPVRTIFGRLRELFNRVRKYLRSLYGDTVKADDIFSKIMSGEIGSREPLDKWKPSEEVFAQASKTPEGPPETPAEGRDYIDATTNDLAEHMREKGPGTYERTLKNLAPPSGPELFARANWAQREFVGPRTVAEIDTKSGRLWSALQREEDEASTRLHDLRDNIRDNFLKLPRENQDRVNGVMELDRLENRTRTDDGRSILARNTNFPDARGSKPGDALILTPEETKAYFGLQRMYREAWDNIMEGSARRMGWTRPWSPAMADNFKEIERAMTTADGQRNRKAFQRIHDVLSAMEEQRRAAYMPLMRFGDYYFSVTPKYGKESTGGFPESAWFSLAERPSFQYADIDPAKMLRFETTQTGQVPDYAKGDLTALQAKYPGKDFRINHGYLLSKPDMLRQMSIPAIEKLMMLLESGVMDRMKTEASMEGFANKGAAYKKAKEDWQNLYEELVDAVRDEMYEQLKAGFKKRSRTVPGYSKDWNRALGTYMGWASRHVARQIHGDAIERIYEDIQTNHPHASIRDYWRDWKQDDDSPMTPLSRIGIAANQLGFMWTMAMKPASTVSIAMHGPTYAIPTLGTGIGVPKAAAAFTKAYGEATTAIRWDDKHGAVIDTMKVGKTPDERAFLKGMEAAGYLHAKGAEDIRSMAEKASAIWGDYTPHAKQAMDILSSNIAVADQANRVAASLAAYRLARDGNLGHMNATWAGNQVWRAISGEEGVSPESMGKFLLNQSVGEWGGRSRSKFGRSFIGRMGSALHGFQIRFLSNLLKQLFRQGGAGRIAAAWSMAALWAAAGLQGLPFVQDAENGIDEIWKALKGKDPMLAWRLRAMLVDTGLGKTGADIVMRGPLSTATGIDFASRLGFGDVITRDIAPWFGAANEMALTFPSIVAGSLRAAKARAGSHQPAAAAAAFLPAALRHPAQAVIDSEHGVKSQSGKTMYVPARKFTGADEAKEAAGFTPLDVARAREHAEFRYRAKNAHGKRPPDTVPR